METITEDYVSFETAKLLKSKKFHVPIRSHYDSRGGFGFLDICEIDWNNYKCFRERRCYSAPTLQMAMKWLRIEYNIHIEPHLVKTKRSYGYMPNYININDLTQHFPFKEIDFCDLEKYVCMTYDKACEVTIKYCLENNLK